MTENDTEKFQGYSNRETFRLCLWMNNDSAVLESLKGIIYFNKSNGLNDKNIEVAVEEFVRELLNPEGQPVRALRPNFLRALYEIGSLWRVNWAEVVADLTDH